MQQFSVINATVQDKHSGLMWTQDAGLSEFPLAWEEALDVVSDLNDRHLEGFSDWRLPNRRELFSLISHRSINPALPAGHPFDRVFNGYYWTGTTCARLPEQAWYVHLGGARVFKGMKHGSYMVWLVRSMPDFPQAVWRSGQTVCYSAAFQPEPCRHRGQDGDQQAGRPWPQPRFEVADETVADLMTGLIWTRCARSGPPQPVNWEDAGHCIQTMNARQAHGHANWRLPTIRELESLCDMSRHSPALPADHPFDTVQNFYWSADTSQYDHRYAWVLYLVDGAVGVGFKPGAEFYVWPVRSRR